MENARLLTETREALEQQTATADVLQVINSSLGDLAPVFDGMLEKAMRLCDAAFGILLIAEAKTAQAVASRNVPEAFTEFLTREPLRLDPETFLAQALRQRSVIHVADAIFGEPYRKSAPLAVAAVELGGIRTMLMVPMIKDGKPYGLFTIYRQEVRPFSEKQIALLQNFAAQAVIAMENARLLNEIRQRQAELRVTFDSMADGVAMFDAQHRLAAWNRNFQQMLDLPDDILEARLSFPEYFDYLAKRGEYGSSELEARLRHGIEETGRELRFERTRPDGRVVEVRRNSVPGGGFVLIYSDITERKRSEAEIRAARDAAETALRNLQAAQASLVQAQKMAALGQLTAGIAHEIKNPLNFVNNFAELSIELLDELTALALTAASVDLSARVIVFESLKKRRKGIYRAVPAPPELLDALDLVHGIREAQQRGQAKALLWPWSRMTAFRRVQEVIAAAGIPDGPHACPKGLRHGFGVQAVSRGIALNMVQKWLGHAQLTTTAIYANAVGEEEQSIAARMW